MTRPVKRSVTIAGHSTSISLEPEFWDALRGICRERGVSVAALLEEIDALRQDSGLSSAARVYALGYFRISLGLLENTSAPPVEDG